MPISLLASKLYCKTFDLKTVFEKKKKKKRENNARKTLHNFRCYVVAG